MKFFALIALIGAASAVKIDGVNGATTTDSFVCKGTPKQIATCSTSMNKYAKDASDAYDANVESHQANVAVAVASMAKDEADRVKANNAALKAQEAAVKAADSNPHD
tara:strand:- start:183 stop:503 length:321 start_codon:yes stop_codon:yes gene_type:complete